MAKTFQFDDFGPKPANLPPHCAACEELFTDALDDLLSPADQAFFDRHLAGCTSCMDNFSQAKRGAAWLDVLKSTPPEPSAALMERILAQTSGQALGQAAPFTELSPAAANVLPFLPRPIPVSRFTRFTRIAMEPRLAMTAAMAFFSIALTMNLLGVRLDQLKAEDLQPSNLKRTYYEATASGHRYYDNLRVVRVLESRVDDYRQSTEDDRREQQLLDHPRPQQQQPAAEPKQEKQPDVPHGSSRREDPMPTAPTLLNAEFRATPEIRRSSVSATLGWSRLHATRLNKEGGLA